MDWTSLDSGKMVSNATNNTRKAGYGAMEYPGLQNEDGTTYNVRPQSITAARPHKEIAILKISDQKHTYTLQTHTSHPITLLGHGVLTTNQ